MNHLVKNWINHLTLWCETDGHGTAAAPLRHGCGLAAARQPQRPSYRNCVPWGVLLHVFYHVKGCVAPNSNAKLLGLGYQV